MECRYCRALNDEEDHRCGRCGRRLRASAARPAPDTYPITTATAPSFMESYQPSAAHDVAATSVQAAPTAPRVTYQRALFSEMQRVVRMPQPAGAEPVSAPRSTRRTPRTRRPVEGQQALDFNAAYQIETPVEAVIYCDAPVALPTHRVMAAALDISMIVMGLGLFLLTFHVAGGEIVLTPQTIPLFGGIAAVLAIFYFFLFCVCDGDTAGMRWTQLRLVNFDGHAPNREQRAYRLIGTCLSLVAAGLGLIWALVDEESLTWHDHISKTFPSPYQTGGQ
jgi:uncharacterized RDD family membrane protein YckC